MGMQVVEHGDLETALVQAQAVANAAFANGGLYLERWIEKPRHISTRFWLTNRETRCLFEREFRCSAVTKSSLKKALLRALILSAARASPAGCGYLYALLKTLAPWKRFTVTAKVVF